MTADMFRRLALELPDTSESAHMNHPDFRVKGKIFASLGYPDEHCGMVKLSPDLQEKYISNAPAAFEPCSGAWGRSGSTTVHLAQARVEIVRSALACAVQLVSLRKKRKPT